MSRRVILVSGPPCAGKTAYVGERARVGDLVLDQDAIGVTRMNAGLADVAAMRTGTAWVIRCLPGPAARDAFAARIGATERVHLVLPERELCRRAAHRTTPGKHLQAVRAWFQRERDDTPEPAFRPVHDW